MLSEGDNMHAEELKNTKEKTSLADASEKERDNLDFVLQAVEQDGSNLRFASERLRDDESVVKTALKTYPYAIEFASERLRSSEEMARYCVSKEGLTLGYFKTELRKNKEIVLLAVEQNGRALVYATDKMKNDEDVVLTAIRNYPYAFKYASERIRAIKKYVFMTLEAEAKFDFVGVDEKWFSDPVFMFEGVKIAPKLLKKFDRSFLTKEMIIAFLRKDGMLLECLPDFSNDFEIVKEAVSQNGMALKFAHKNMRNNLEIALTAMARDIEASRYIGEKARSFLSEIGVHYPAVFKD